MSYKKFANVDLFYNVIKAKPRFEFKIYRGVAVANNKNSDAILNNLQITPPDLTAGGCANPNSLDFSCEENSSYIGVI